MKNYLYLIALLVSLAGCEGAKSPESPMFELRDFVVTEEKTAATAYSKEWNSFSGNGTLIARNVDKDRNLVVLLEIRDETKGPSAEPELGSILLQGGLGKIQTRKSKYNEISPPPKYNWRVIGWYELNRAGIEVPGQVSK